MACQHEWRCTKCKMHKDDHGHKWEIRGKLAFTALDSTIRKMKVKDEIRVRDDDKAPVNMWSFVGKYKPMRFRIKRAEGFYTITRRLDFDKRAGKKG